MNLCRPMVLPVWNKKTGTFFSIDWELFMNHYRSKKCLPLQLTPKKKTHSLLKNAKRIMVIKAEISNKVLYFVIKSIFPYNTQNNYYNTMMSIII